MKSRDRFGRLKHIEITSFYQVGERPGGEFFDVIQSKEGWRSLVLVTDSPTYRQSAMLLDDLLELSPSLNEVSSHRLDEVYVHLHEKWSDWSQRDYFQFFIVKIDFKTRQFEVSGNGKMVLECYRNNSLVWSRQAGETSPLMLEERDELILWSDGAYRSKLQKGSAGPGLTMDSEAMLGRLKEDSEENLSEDRTVIRIKPTWPILKLVG